MNIISRLSCFRNRIVHLEIISAIKPIKPTKSFTLTATKRKLNTTATAPSGSKTDTANKIPTDTQFRVEREETAASKKQRVLENPNTLKPPSDMKITLTEKEQDICSVLENVVERIHKQQPSEPPLVLRIAGGWVRDKLLGLESHDLDIAIDHMSGYDLAQHVNQYLQDTGHPVRTIAKISQNPERSKHLETATTSVLGLLVDFVNLRSEIYNSDSRIPQISYGTPSEDAFRRDITINALFYNIHTKQVEDFTARGLDDLRAGIVRTPLEPFKTFTDDPLRVLRVLRFASRFGYEIEQSTSEAIGRPEIKDDLDAKISRERVGAELEKMVEGPNPLLAIQMILQYGLYDNIFRAPGMEEKQYMVGKDAAVTEQLTRNILQLLGQTDSAALVNRIPEGFSVLSDSQARRALILSAYLYPFHGMQTPNGKRLLAQVVIRDGLKLSNQDIDAVTALHTLAPVFSQGAKDCQNDQATRTSLGLQIRQAGKRWPAAVVFAAAVEMLHQPSAQETSNVGNRYAGYADRILAENLQEAYLLKHLVDGKVAASVLGIRPGPAIKGVLEQIMEWQLGNPKGTQEQCKEYIVQVISPTLAK